VSGLTWDNKFKLTALKKTRKIILLINSSFQSFFYVSISSSLIDADALQDKSLILYSTPHMPPSYKNIFSCQVVFASSLTVTLYSVK